MSNPKSPSAMRVRRATLLALVRQPGPLDNTPKNRWQRRAAERALRKLDQATGRKK